MTSVPDNLTPGAKAEFRIKVKNTGNEKAESVSLRVFKDASQPFEFDEKSDFIGKLEKGDSGDAVLRVTVDNNAAAKKYLLDVELRGIDEKNNVVIFSRTVPITVNPAPRNLPATGIFWGFDGHRWAVAIGYYLKKRKNL